MLPHGRSAISKRRRRDHPSMCASRAHRRGWSASPDRARSSSGSGALLRLEQSIGRPDRVRGHASRCQGLDWASSCARCAATHADRVPGPLRQRCQPAHVDRADHRGRPQGPSTTWRHAGGARCHMIAEAMRGSGPRPGDAATATRTNSRAVSASASRSPGRWC